MCSLVCLYYLSLSISNKGKNNQNWLFFLRSENYNGVFQKKKITEFSKSFNEISKDIIFWILLILIFIFLKSRIYFRWCKIYYEILKDKWRPLDNISNQAYLLRFCFRRNRTILTFHETDGYKKQINSI